MKTKVGLFGIGLDTYWAQFDGLLDNLKAYQEQIKTKIAGFGVEVADAVVTVNGQTVNPAFKSVRLEPGKNRIEIRVNSF